MLRRKSVFYQGLKQIGLQGLQESMSRALGLAVMVAYPDGPPLTEPSNLCPFCAMLDSNSEGRTRCAASHGACALAAAATGEDVLRTCHAGLAHLAVPLQVAGETTVAVVLGGNVAMQPLAEEAVVQLARETGIDPEKLVGAAGEVPLWTEERLRTVLAAVRHVTATVAELLYAKQELAALFEFSRTVSGSLEVAEVARRAELFQAWLRKRILVQDPRPGIYLYHTHFTHDGERFVRQGLIALLDLRESRAKAHERTLRGPKEDRLKLIRATEAHLEHIFLLYWDPERRATRAVDQAIAGRPPDMEARDDFGNAHLVWYIPDEQALRAVKETLAPLDLYIADGHHRFETARAFMQECLDRGWRPAGPESFTSIPVTLVNAAEPGA